jgi:FkbM family methyltransferase
MRGEFVYWFFILFLPILLEASKMQELLSLHAPLRQDGKIHIPLDVEHIKLDIGLSYSAPMSQHWLSHEENLWVFGFEPDVNSVQTIKRGAIKLEPYHGEPLDPKYVGTRFFVFPCALSHVSDSVMDFYITKESCGCSSLYPPKTFEVEKVVQVPVFRLADFFDLFPFDTHPVIDYIKIDAQGSDLDIVKGAGHYLSERVVYITIEPENEQYMHTVNGERDIDNYMRAMGFERIFSKDTGDPTYFNPRFREYVNRHAVVIFQQG